VKVAADWKMSVDVGSGRNYVTLGHPTGDQSPTWSVQCWETLDQVDHLILLPERALTMDSGWLQADLAEILAQSAVIGVPAAAAIMAVHQQASTQERRRSLDWGLLNSGHSLVAVAQPATGGTNSSGTRSPVGPILHKTSSCKWDSFVSSRLWLTLHFLLLIGRLRVVKFRPIASECCGPWPSPAS